MRAAASLALAGTMLVLTGALAQTPKKPAPARRDTVAASDKAAFFDKQAWPILKASCVACHAGDSPSGGLDLTRREAVLKGGASGPAVDLAKPEASLLIRAVHYDGRQMPPQGKLPQAQIETLTRWVKLGAPWSASRAAAAAPVKHGPPAVNAETMRFWSFQPVKRPGVPKVKNAAWVRTPVDAFVLSKLEKAGFTPAAPASRAALLRRAYFDVLGLPPTPEEVRAFVADKSPNAWEKVVDRLLASPHYGERWGRHWLDLVRYAETNSYERDGDKPFVWRYRDYVIRSFNDDKPYDRFLKEQLAGDELPNRTPETLIATGYYRLGLWDDEPADPEQARFDDLDDIVSTTAQTFLGLTVGCARCHDHKIDPIPTKDYYRMVAFFRNVNRYGVRSNESVAEASLRPISSPEEQKRYAAESAVFKAKLDELDGKIVAVEKVVRPVLQGGERDDFRNEMNRAPIVKKRVPSLVSEAVYADYVRLLEERSKLRAAPPKGLEMALCVTEAGGEVPPTFVLGRGSVHAPGAKVTPGFLSVLNPPQPRVPALAKDAPTSGRRALLADWIADPKNPLTARVMANRVWQFHFGRGIVRSTSNFGFMGTAPTHPELLDYLASELVKGGWRLKPLHRQILLSSAYRMSSAANPKHLAKDPENDLLWRFDMRRLDAEEVRDAILVANGSLNPKMYGPSITVTLPQEVLAGQSVPGQGWGRTEPEEQRRRSVYVKIKRSLSVPILASFDAADTDNTCPVRFATTQPTQALGMMNSAFVNEQARVFADFVKAKAGTDPAARVRLVLWRVLQREPTAKEVQRGVRYLTDTQLQDAKGADDALASFCLVALNLNEFIYLD